VPCDYRKYPRDWPAIRARILARAGNRCEGTKQFPHCRAENGKPHPWTGSIVVLTIAHIHDPDPMNCDEANIKALCQRCHLNWDRAHHLAVQRRNREERKRREQPVLLEVG
jgi:hypothetical protein